MDKIAIAELIKLYKNGGVTEHVLEREFSNFLGDHVECQVLAAPSVSTATSFGIFPAVEFRVNGMFLKLLIDRPALLSIYSENEFEKVLTNVKNQVQKLLRKFNEVRTSSIELAPSEVLSKYLEAYLLLLPSLSVGRDDFLPAHSDIQNKISELNGNTFDSIIEELKLKDFLPGNITELILNTSKNINKTIFELNNKEGELPEINYARKDRLAVCNGISVDYAHAEIAYDYLPETNQR